MEWSEAYIHKPVTLDVHASNLTYNHQKTGKQFKCPSTGKRLKGGKSM